MPLVLSSATPPATASTPAGAEAAGSHDAGATADLARSAYLSGRRGGALHGGDVSLHLGLAAPHRAADQAPRERQASSGAYSGCGLQEVSAEHR